MLFVLDEIQTGLGRTGKMFAYEHEAGAEPDVLVLGKALGGGVYPVSAVLASRTLMTLFRPGDHGSTFGGNPLAAAVGRAALAVLVDERLAERAAAQGKYLFGKLEALRAPCIVELRGRGLLVGIEIAAAAGSARGFASACWRAACSRRTLTSRSSGSRRRSRSNGWSSTGSSNNCESYWEHRHDSILGRTRGPHRARCRRSRGRRRRRRRCLASAASRPQPRLRPPQRSRLTRIACGPVVSPKATISAEVTGPGAMFPALFSLPKGDDFAHFGYEAHEYFVTGTAAGQPYKTRIVIRKPSDDSRFSGLVLAESMHPSGNAWMFHFTHRYTMSEGHIGVEIVTSGLPQLVNHNAARYRDLAIANEQVNEVIAQVGAALKSRDRANPLGRLPLRKMVLGGTSASAAVLVRYLPAHLVYRLPDMAPIYDGFLPTSTAAEIDKTDVPMIEVPTMTEVARGASVLRQDGDAPGDRFRVYEVAGIGHLDVRDVDAFRPNPCAHPISLHPIGTGFSVALHYLLQWVDRGIAPPYAPRILDRSRRPQRRLSDAARCARATCRVACRARTSRCRSPSTRRPTRPRSRTRPTCIRGQIAASRASRRSAG